MTMIQRPIPPFVAALCEAGEYAGYEAKPS